MATRLLIACPDKPGIIADVAGFMAAHGGNIIAADQHTDSETLQFFMRLEVEGLSLDKGSFSEAWRELSERHEMKWRAHWGTRRRMAILVSKQDHCLTDLLWRTDDGEIDADVPLVISNHRDLEKRATTYGIDFYHLPVTDGAKADQESSIQELLNEAGVDFIVLARYMQILSPEFVGQWQNRIINIHHSFLPAFAGSKPYHQAYERGVKIIGATSHYVTDELDEGPIIAQATLPVGHRDSIDDMIRKGRDLERVVLATAVRHHTEDRVIVSGKRTIVFD
jgi:formyltetrahydrofolate deformylase